MSPLLLIFAFVFATIDSHKPPKRYVIDLDELPERRWTHVVKDNLEFLPGVAAEAKKFIPTRLQPLVWWFASKIGKLIPDEYYREMQGISEASGLPIGEIVGLNILYDITAFDRSHILYQGCTSIVAQNSKGEIFHGRNLDYEMGGLLKNITVLLDFKKDGKIIYSGTTFALYNGLLTGQRPYSYTVTLNERYSGAYIDTIIMELYTHFKNPVALFIRQTLETETTFKGAVKKFSNTPLVAPSYIIVGGTKSEEGAVISRGRLKAADTYFLESKSDRWFLVETNFDHWKKDIDGRRIEAENFLKSMGQKKMDETLMAAALGRVPVKNNQTIYSTVLSANNPQWFMESFKVWD